MRPHRHDGDAAAATGPARPVAGVVWMLVAGVFFVAVTAAVKHVGDRLPAAETAFLRYLLGLVFLVPLFGTLRRARIDRATVRIYAGRGLVHGLGVILWFYAMTRIPLAEVTAMNYLSPVWVSIGAVVFLGERMGWPRICAIIGALAGVAIILRPGFRAVDPGHVAMLGAAILLAGSYLLAKRLSDTQSPALVVTMLSIFTTIALAPFAAAVWVWPSMGELGWLLVVGALATSGHYAMTLAFRAAPITLTQPVTFLQLVWATLVGVLLFAEPLDAGVIAGGTVIVLSVLVITLREARLAPKTTPPPTP